MSSLDLIKKQKSALRQEKRKVVEGEKFSHPLAYQPIPKGRQRALREKFNSGRRGTMDFSISNRNAFAPRRKVSAKKARFSSDMGSSHLSSSHFSSSTPGSSMSDVLTPKSHFHPKRPSTARGTKTVADNQQESNYNKEVQIDIKLNQEPVQPKGQGREINKQPPVSVKAVQTDSSPLENQDPEYIENAEGEIELPDYSHEDIFGNTPNLFEAEKQEKKQEKKDENTIEVIPREINPERRSRITGTTVKQSFRKPVKSVKVKPVREPWEKAAPPTPAAPPKIVRKKTPVIEVTEVPRHSEEKQKEWGSVSIPTYSPEESKREEFLRDYQPVRIQEEVKKRKSYLSKLVKRLKDKVRTRIIPSDNLTKVIDYGYQDGQIQKEEPKIVKKKKSKWLEKAFTPREEKIIDKSFDYTRKPIETAKAGLFNWRTANAKRSVAVLVIGLGISLSVPLGAYVQKVIEAKNEIEEKSEEAYEDTKNAQSAIMSVNPDEARKNFDSAYQNFLSASQSLDDVGGIVLAIVKILPGGSKVKSGELLLEGGKHLALSGQIISEAFDLFLGKEGALRKKFLSTNNLSHLQEAATYTPPEKQEEAKSLTDAIIIFQEKLGKAKVELESAKEVFEKVEIEDLPEEKQEEFEKLKQQIPVITSSLDNFSNYTDFLLNILGHNESKRYLFLFQNNHEMRATGGFIGTYGIMKMDEGNISQLIVEGIYNPDGQLKERIIPPKPIQKMSATWSMHDANWWPDFPKSAEKVAWFYEKTGGPTVDGVIALNPPVIKKFLEITGPIELEKYGVTVDADNFIDIAQYKVEVDYDKKLNRPKQILADLTPLILDKIMSAPPSQWMEVMGVFSECLDQRHIMMYFFDYNVQQTVSELGWSGEVIKSPKDYLMVVNTNISGMKTDRMIDQKINHTSEIQPDGSIIDTVEITRTHNGGDEEFEWYNAVNSNWQRIYVPEGSELLSAEGYTREINAAPVDYKKLEFIEDEMVVMEESSVKMDPHTGTRVYEDSGKTVFANWTYVSPGETLTIKYSYLLPFKLRFDEIKKPADTYSLLIQKQAGDERSRITSEAKGLENYKIIYHYPKELPLPNWKLDLEFKEDIFAGLVLMEQDSQFVVEE